MRSAHFQNKLIAYLTTYSVPLHTTSCTLVYKQFTRDDEAKSQFTANISCQRVDVMDVKVTKKQQSTKIVEWEQRSNQLKSQVIVTASTAVEIIQANADFASTRKITNAYVHSPTKKQLLKMTSAHKAVLLEHKLKAEGCLATAQILECSRHCCQSRRVA